ncbi:MAG: DNA polymerase I [Lachnospiraceae bacterium]|nr:DNA polymerase I [Lachnospiraceae bacterium]
MKILLIDGHSMANRGFYGAPDLTNSDGVHTGAVFAFLNIMLKVMGDEEPDYMAVAFDEHAPTFRHEIYEDYKGKRKPMPEALREQIPLIKDLVKRMGIARVSFPGLEADDILGSIARAANEADIDAVILSGDRDLLQLVTDHTKLIQPRTAKGETVVHEYYPADVLAEYKVEPKKIIDLKALMGDTSDNIPGLPKVGEKTATELLIEYGDLDSIKENIPNIKKKALRENLEKNFALAELSRTLATIKTDVDLTELSFDFETARLKDIYTKEAFELIRSLELKSFYGKFQGMEEEAANREKLKFRIVTDLGEAEELFAAAKKAEKVSFALEGEAGDLSKATIVKDSEEKEAPSDGLKITGVAFAFADEGYYIESQGFFSNFYLKAHVNSLIEDAVGKVFTANLKKELSLISPSKGMDKLFSLEILMYVLDPGRSDYDIPADARQAALMAYERGETLLGKIRSQSRDDTGDKAFSLTYILREIEMPLTPILKYIEDIGVRVQREELNSFSEELGEKAEKLRQEIIEEAGEDFNVNSPQQLGNILFEKLGLPNGKKNKNGYSTSAEILEKLAPEHKIVRNVLEYRTLSKLKSTYADALPNFISTDGRIHSSFNQTVTATGRISSSDPNLQNIPVRTEMGRRFRKIFIPEDGFTFMDADYSQIELRILSSLSGDERLIEAFLEGKDIHSVTASQVFHVPLEEVDSDLRRKAKAVNFGIVYGESAYGLSQNLSIPTSEAKSYINSYFETYPKVRIFLDGLINKAKETGYAETLYGRRRYIGELKQSNFAVRQFGERVAMNAPIQGTAADIIKIAMIQVYETLQRENLKSRLVLQVHDELLIETAAGEEDIVKKILKEKMMEAGSLSVPLIVDINSGKNWYEAH